MLDVGCAHGWFIEACIDRYDVTGIEPDVAVAAATSARGLPVKNGFFPQVLRKGELFDVIVFNDVLEHIPDVNAVLCACREHLSDHGIVVVNAPSRKGALYALAGALAKSGMTGPFDRLWQEGLPSPHVHYFDGSSIENLALKNGFLLEQTMALPSVSLSGLYDRIHCAGQVNALKAAALTMAVAMAYPLIRMLPSDIEVWFLRKEGVREAVS